MLSPFKYDIKITKHYNDVIIRAMASQITSIAIVYSTVYSRRRPKKTSKPRVIGLCEGIHRWPVNSPHKGPVTRKMLPFDDVIMKLGVKLAKPNWLTRKLVPFHTGICKVVSDYMYNETESLDHQSLDALCEIMMLSCDIWPILNLLRYEPWHQTMPLSTDGSWGIWWTTESTLQSLKLWCYFWQK